MAKTTKIKSHLNMTPTSLKKTLKTKTNNQKEQKFSQARPFLLLTLHKRTSQPKSPSKLKIRRTK
jgi:hypothetical protein